MSKCRPKNEEFIKNLKNDIYKHYNCIYSSVSDVKIYYDAHPTWAKRDYVLNMTVSRDWNGEDTKWLKRFLSSHGASNVIGCKRHAIARDYVDFAFDEKVRKTT